MKYNNVIDYEITFKKPKSDYPIFYLIGICNNGSRHYSKDMTYEEALQEMPRYIGVVEYFGGGVVRLMEKPNKCIKFKNV